ncbi:IS110 family transposase [Frateuria sp. STR12]|uniref:IS110 family transposase n=1 Tax=Frateuria hangzhouensis TaxID=2995589 RepID=UPI002260C950|nr:IS110 family transposase [Frateuria sp. STR12]MCX7515412.1 IS110 family transposase [Frateuria sp. STR12]
MNTHVGIDVGARSLSVAWRQHDRTAGSANFEQTRAGHAKLIKRLRSLKPERIVLEATGVYYLDIATALVDKGLPVAVINPKSFHHFAQLKLARSKTDPIDAALLAEYAACLRPPLWTPPSTTALALRDIGRQINRLTKARTQAKNRLHAFHAKHETLSLLIEDQIEAIAALKARIERLKQAARDLMKAAPGLAAQHKCLMSASGVGEASAIALLAELSVLPTHLKAPQVSRHAGLDVRLCQSGTSVSKAARLSKTGNAYLRSALFMPAMTAVRRNPPARAFYEALVHRGKKKMQALAAVMRKYLTGLWACMQRGETFDPTKLFSACHLARG